MMEQLDKAWQTVRLAGGWQAKAPAPLGSCALFLLLALPVSAAVTGTVMNGTTGAPQSAVKVTLYRFGQGGMEPVTDTKTDAQGRFTINQELTGRGPAMLRVEVDDVAYNHMIPPGTPSTGLTLQVYNATGQRPQGVRVSKHMLVFQPTPGGPMTVSETFLVENSGKSTWFDPGNGTLRFYLPAGAQGKVEATGTAPDGMAIPIPTGRTAADDVYATKFEIKPGETRFDLNYAVPYTAGAPYAGKIASQDENTYLVAPPGVTLKGAGLKDLGEEPRSHSRIYGLSARAYRIELAGAVAAAAAEPAADSGADQQDSGSRIEIMLPRVYGKAGLIVGLALAILALGFVLLYRARVPGAKESDERGRG